MAAAASEEDIISLDGSSDDDLPSVNEMIQGVIGDHPAATSKFLVNTPAIMEKQAKKQEQKDKCATKRKLDSDSKSTDTKANKGKKRKVDDDDNEPPITVTYYIYIAKPPPLKSNRRGAKAAADDILQKGPFHLCTSQSYTSLISAIAAELPCRVEHIPKTKITWKPKIPKAADKLPLQNEIGYQALVTDMEGKAPDKRVVLLYMPPPVHPMEDVVPWDTNHDPDPVFDYSELEPSGASDSIEQQKVSFNKATKEEREKLEQKYPIGNYPNFPDRRVYFDSATGFYFELNSTRLGVWSSAMSQGKTDENTPPASKFFDANQRIKAVPAIIPHVPVPLAAPTIPVHTAVPAPAPAPSFSDLLFASLLSGGGLAGLLNPNSAVAPAPRAPQPRPAPLSPIKRHSITVERFCELYALEEKDAVLLNEVGFRPGDQTDVSVDDELKRMGFTIFSWKRIHNANLHFKADLAAGMFD